LKFIVVTGGTHRGAALWYLRGTTWSADSERATSFDTEELAHAQLDRARKFMRPETFRACRVIERPQGESP
jgi:hypothetical protein